LRRPYDGRPPPVAADREHHPANDPRYAALPPDVLPATECLKDVLERMLPWWQDAICADLAAGWRPSCEVLRADGFELSAFAYPFGARTGELDRALLAEVPILRSVSFSYTGVIASPCPR